MQQDGLTLPGLSGSGELYMDILRIICNPLPSQSMCDLGCHHAPFTPQLGYKNRAYVDIQNRPLDYSQEQQYFVQDDIFAYLRTHNKWFDVTIASDVIEHLTTEQGYELLGLMKFYSAKQVIFTPLGAYMVDEPNIHPDAHRSGWVPDMLLGWLSIVLPNFHPQLNIGAFFAVNCSDEEKERIFNGIKTKYAKD